MVYRFSEIQKPVSGYTAYFTSDRQEPLSRKRVMRSRLRGSVPESGSHLLLLILAHHFMFFFQFFI